MLAQLMSSVFIFTTSILGVGAYFMRMEFVMGGFGSYAHSYVPKHQQRSLSPAC